MKITEFYKETSWMQARLIGYEQVRQIEEAETAGGS